MSDKSSDGRPSVSEFRERFVERMSAQEPRRGSHVRRILVVPVVALLGLGGTGMAIAALIDDSPAGPHKAASECPEAQAALAEKGLEPAYFVPGCPTDEELASQLADLEQDEAIIRDCEDKRERDELTGLCTRILEYQAELRGED